MSAALERCYETIRVTALSPTIGAEIDGVRMTPEG